MRKYLHWRLKPLTNALLRQWSRRVAPWYDINNTILVAGSPRGGSTWLAELIGTLPGYPMLWEPLHIRRNPEAAECGFDWETYLHPDDEDERKLDYLLGVLKGAHLSTRLARPSGFRIRDAVRFRGYVVKFVRGNMILPWLLRRIPLRTVLIIRHPCAVVLSQMRHSSWANFDRNNITVPAGIERHFPHVPDVASRVVSKAQALAFQWSLQTLVPLSAAIDTLYLTSYERMVEEGPDESRRIFSYLNEPMPRQVNNRLRKPSKTTQTGSHVADGKNPLTFWRSKLSSREIEEILDIVHRMGIEFYTEELHPENQILSNFLQARRTSSRISS